MFVFAYMWKLMNKNLEFELLNLFRKAMNNNVIHV